MPPPRLTLGTAQLGQSYGIANRHGLPASSDVFDILDAAMDSQVTRIDTAPAYGLAEQRLGEFITQRRIAGQLEICTKLPAAIDTDAHGVASWVVTSVESSLRRLTVDFIDCYLIHRTEDLLRLGGALIDALNEQRMRGRIGRFGISAYVPEESQLLERYPELGAIQFPLNLLDHRFLPTINRLADTGRVELQVRSVFLQGLFALSPDELSKSVPRAQEPVSRLHKLLGAWNTSSIQVALPFVMQTSTDQVIVGVDSREQLRANVIDAGRTLPKGLFEEILALFTDVPEDIIDPRRWDQATG